MPRGKPFPKGVSGNPKGRPKGLKDRRHALRDMIREAAPEMVAALVRKARAGDVSAASLLLARAVPPLRAVDEPLHGITLPDGIGDQARMVLRAIAAGTVTPDAGASLMASINTAARVLEAGELEARLVELEARLQEWERKTVASGSKD
jgi:hypothetical protein